MSDQKRIENLERVVRHLVAEVASLRASVEAISGRPASTTSVDPAMPEVVAHDADAPALPAEEPAIPLVASGERPVDEVDVAVAAASGGDAPGGGAAPFARRGSAAPPRRARDIRIDTRGIDLESLVGRYGAMVLAALTILLGVGAFIGWAVEHVELGPRARVTLGALGAVAVAVFGEVLRRRGARSYGNSLLALALALVHLVAWGAGPSLGVIPTGVALAVAIVASLALSLLAVHEGEELLFVVGLVGSLVAPFAFAGPEGSMWALLAYGAAVRIAAMHAVRGRTWSWAERTLAIGAASYALATLAVAAAAPEGRVVDRVAPALFMLVCMASATLQGGRGGRHVALADAVTLVVAIGLLEQITEVGLSAAGLGITGTGLGYLALTRTEPEERTVPWLWALVIPASLLTVALAALERPNGDTGAMVALTWTAAAGVAAFVDLGRARGAHAFFAGLAGSLAIVLWLYDQEVKLPVGLAVWSVLLATIATRARLRELLGSAWIGLGAAWLIAQGELMQRMPWSYQPFATSESAVMLVVVVATWALAWSTSQLAREEGSLESANLAAAATPLVAFVWGRTELARAFSQETATFLLIVYYATSGTVALLAGRRTGRTVMRRAGLGLAIFAALKALGQASSLSMVALRIGSYLLVGCFLLAVAYWYRAGSRGPEEPSPA